MAIRIGGPGADSLAGTAGSDILLGGGEDDRLDGLDGFDLVLGQDGDDTVAGGPGDDAVLGGSGDDRMIGDALGGGPNPAPAGGTPGNNLLLGGDGDDSVRAGYGRDAVFGGRGDDVIDGWGFGPPSPSGEAAFKALDLADLLWGGGGNDSIDGGGGDDCLHGGTGDDTLRGTYGVDTVTGGADADRFVFGRLGIANETLDSGIGAGRRDVVTDFRPSEGDVLDLSAYRSPFLDSDVPPEFLGTDPFERTLNLQVRYEVEDHRTILQIYSPFNAPPPELGLPPPEPSVTVEIELRGVRGVSAEDVLLG